MMESEISQVISLIGQRRFGSVFDITLDVEGLVLKSRSGKTVSKSTLSLTEKIELLQPHGCYSVFSSKTHNELRAFPLHGESGNCDMNALYQVVAHDTVPGTQMLIFHSATSGIDNIEGQHGVAGVAFESDVQLTFFCEQPLTKAAKRAMGNIASYTGGNFYEVENVDDFSDYIETKLGRDRGIVLKQQPEKGSTRTSFLMDDHSTNPLLEVTCNKELYSVRLAAVGGGTDIDLLHSIDSLIVKSGELSVIRLDAEESLNLGWYDILVDCEGKYEVTVTVTSDINAYKVHTSAKLPREQLGRLALSANQNVDQVEYNTDSGDQVTLLQAQPSPQIIDIGTRRDLEAGPAWATISIGNIVRLKRASIPLFQLQDNIEGLVLEPGETLDIAFVAYNQAAEYDLSVTSSHNDWEVHLMSNHTTSASESTPVVVRVFVPIDAKGIQTCTVTLAAASTVNGKTVSTFMMTLVADETPDIPAGKTDINVGIIQRLATVTAIGSFDNTLHYSRREAIFSVMVPPSGFVTELTIIYNGEEFSSKVRLPSDVPGPIKSALPSFLTQVANDMNMDVTSDDPAIYARNFQLAELLSQTGEKMSLVKLHQDKNRLVVKSVVEAGHTIDFRIVTEELLERTRFRYDHTVGVAQYAEKYTYQLLIEDKLPLTSMRFGQASNAFFKHSASLISEPGAKMAFISHSWSPEDNVGHDPFYQLFSVEFDVAHPAEQPCDLNWNGDEKYFISRCRIKDVKVDRPVHAIFLLDTSSSMHGHRARQAQDIINYMIRQLAPTDKFNVMRFDSEEELLVEEDMMAMTEENIQKALQFMHRPSLGGGTNIYTAVVRALIALLQNSSGYALPNIFLITDGEATVGVTDPEVILNTVDYVRASRKMHINTIHLGNEVPSSFTRRLAQLGQGMIFVYDSKITTTR